MSSEAISRGPGRPRDARAEAAILEAALESFMEDGYQGLSIEGVAARAGVGKTTIYRRWPGKEQLVAAAVGCITEQLGTPDTGSLRGDLVEALGRVQGSRLSGKSFARLVAELSANPALGPIYRDNVIAPRRAMLSEVLRRGVERGELRADVDFELVLDLLAGPVLLDGLLAQVDPSRRERPVAEVVDAVLQGLGPR